MSSRKTKFAEIKRALKKNRTIVVVATRVDCFRRPLINPQGDPTHIIRLLVAPVKSVWGVRALRGVLNSLLPGMTPSSQQDVQDGSQGMVLGRMVFLENIGKKTVVCTTSIRQADMAGLDGFIQTGRKTTHEEVVHRAIEIKLYPSAALARLMVDTNNWHQESVPWTDVLHVG